jgi:hypothetical protein
MATSPKAGGAGANLPSVLGGALMFALLVIALFMQVTGMKTSSASPTSSPASSPTASTSEDTPQAPPDPATPVSTASTLPPPSSWFITPSPAGLNPKVQPEVSQAAANAFNSDPFVAKLAAMGVVFFAGDDHTATPGDLPAPGECLLVSHDVTDPRPYKDGVKRILSVQDANRTCTPGAVHSSRLANALLAKTNCPSTDNFRPSTSLTNKVKKALVAAADLHPSSTEFSKIELDHLAPETLCGASVVKNFAVMPPTSKTQKGTYNGKDYPEQQLYWHVTKHGLSVSEALYRLLSDWPTSLSGLEPGAAS